MREIRKTIQYVLLALIPLALLIGVHSSGTRDTEQAEPASGAKQASGTEPEPTPTPAPLTWKKEPGHPALMGRSGDGAFRPEDPLTEGELARAIGALTEGLTYPASAVWLGTDGVQGVYRTAAGLQEAGILVPAEGTFRADVPVDREELAGTLERLARHLTGKDKKAVAGLARDVAGDTVLNSETPAEGPGPLTRREAAVALVRLAGREPEREALFQAGMLPSDVSGDDWTWAYMADAALEGGVPPHGPGFFRACGGLYTAAEDGALITDQAFGVWSFGPDGRYTTGDAKLDQQIAEALEASGANALSGQEALQAAYLYVKDNFEYKLTPKDQTPEEVGSTGWEYERASRFFRYGGGTCYGYAATFGLMARALGENAQIVAAEVNQFYGDHAFVVIPEDGVDWIYDVELEDARPERHEDLALFRIQNFEIYNYWYTPDW